MTFQQIRCILEIARCGSITRAANQLYVAQPALSCMVKDLESQLGIRIFSRSSKGVELTDEGKRFIVYVEPLLEQHDKILDIYAHQKETPPMQLSISLQRFVFVIKSFAETLQGISNEKYEFHLREEGMHQIIKDVQEQKSHLGLIYTSDTTQHIIAKMLTSHGLTYTPLARLSPRVFFRRDHPMAGESIVCISQMQNYPLVIFEEEDFVALDYAEEIALNGTAPNTKRLYVKERATMVDLILHSDAFSIGTAVLPDGYIGDGMVSRVISGHEGEITLGYIRDPNSAWEPILDEFLDRIRTEVGKYLYSS